MLGMARAFSTSFEASRSTAESTPRITPRVRRWRTSARVSRPETTGMPWRLRNKLASRSERQLLAMAENSRTTSPSMYGRADSLSDAAVP